MAVTAVTARDNAGSHSGTREAHVGLLTHFPFFWDEWLLPAQACAQAVWSRAKLCHPRLALNSWLFLKKKKFR